MPIFDIVALSAIVIVFIGLGGVLAFVTWYSSGKRGHARRGAGHRNGRSTAIGA